jgi:hypothetical protein
MQLLVFAESQKNKIYLNIHVNQEGKHHKYYHKYLQNEDIENNIDYSSFKENHLKIE